MCLPQGYHREGKTPSNTICRLHKSIYGLKQASRQWFAKFSSVLLRKSFTQSSLDHSLFIKNNVNSFVAVFVYVDDVIVANNDSNNIAYLKCFVDSKFKLKDLGQLQYFLSLEVARSKKGISISQRHSALQLLWEARFLGFKPTATRMEANIKLTHDDGEPLKDPELCKRLIGKLLYLTITRPDLPYAVN